MNFFSFKPAGAKSLSWTHIVIVCILKKKHDVQALSAYFKKFFATQVKSFFIQLNGLI
jgi:hypothetical protein